MNDAWATLIAAFGGFIFAFFLEPIKTAWQNKIRRDNLRLALYKELMFNYESLDYIASRSLQRSKPISERSFKALERNI
ncbi:MAG: hypothetical protein ACXWNQ_08645, partial [Anaerolineales bacterium]